MSITDELREYADRLSDEAARKSEHGFSPVAMKLEGIADHIDAEMVELPRDADGVPIHVGDTVYGCRSGMKMTISELRMTANGWSISTSRGYLTDAELTHAQPDSWKLIADELEAWCDRVDVDGDACDKPRDIVERIRRLAKKDER